MLSYKANVLLHIGVDRVRFYFGIHFVLLGTDNVASEDSLHCYVEE